MKKLRLYIETSTWNFVYADDAPEKKSVTEDFFSVVGKGVYDIFISDVVLLEIGRASGPVKKRLENLIEHYKPLLLESSPEAKKLAELYVQRGVIPPNKFEDALHVGIATAAEMDALVTWD